MSRDEFQLGLEIARGQEIVKSGVINLLKIGRDWIRIN